MLLQSTGDFLGVGGGRWGKKKILASGKKVDGFICFGGDFAGRGRGPLIFREEKPKNKGGKGKNLSILFRSGEEW